MSTYASANALEGGVIAHELAIEETVMKSTGVAAIGLEVSFANFVSIDTTFGSCMLRFAFASMSSFVVLHSIVEKVILSSDSSREVFSQNDPDYANTIPFESEFEEGKERDKDLAEPSTPKKKIKKNYNLTRRFQMEWLAKLP